MFNISSVLQHSEQKRKPPGYNLTNSSEAVYTGQGDPVIVTGWTQPEKIYNALKPEEFGALGPLYNPNYGISLLLSNLLANPYYTQIFILSGTKLDENNRSCEALYNFFKQGFVDTGVNWSITSSDSKEVIGSIDKVFSKETLDGLRQGGLYDVRLFKSREELIQACQSNFGVSRGRSKLREPIYIQVPKEEKVILPANIYAHSIEDETISEIWLKALFFIRNNGRIIKNRQEVINLVTVITKEPKDLSWKRWMPTSKEQIKQYVNNITLGDWSKEVTYTYGSRIRKQKLNRVGPDGEPLLLDQIIETAKKIAEDKDSTQFLISVWIAEEDFYSKAPPCLTMIWLRVVNNKLAMCVTFRSHDIYTAYLSNLMAMRSLQEVVIKEVTNLNKDLKLEAGPIICNSQSAHIYDWCFKDADALLQKHYNHKEKYTDAVGNFTLKIKDENLVVEQFSPKGEYLRELVYNINTDPLVIIRDLARLNPTIKATHLGYLGIEVHRALSQAKNKVEYTQDTA